MIVARPGGLQEALNDAASQDDFVRCENGGDFSPSNVTVPAGVRCDARGATFDDSNVGDSGTLFTCASGGHVQGGWVRIRDRGFTGIVFDVDAADGETITGPTGPQDTKLFGKYYATDDDSVERGTALRLRAQDGGVIDSMSAFFHAHHLYYTLYAVAEAGGRVTNNDAYVRNGQGYSSVEQHGRGEFSGNTWFPGVQPNSDTSTHHWLVNAPNAHDEWCEGYLWDPHKMARPWNVHIERADGNILYGNAQDRTEEQNNRFHKFVDRSTSAGNRTISLNSEVGPSAEGTRQALGFPGNDRRFEVRRFHRAAGLLDGSGTAPGPEPGEEFDHELVVQGTGSFTEYEFEVSGALAGGSDADSSGDGADTISGSTAAGAVNNQGADNYYYDGDLLSFARNGDLELFVDGQQVDPDEYAANDPPTASDDTASVTSGESVTIDVVADDSDADGSLDASTVRVLTPPSNGSTTVDSDGTIDYAHDGSSTDADSFGYTIDDDDGATSNEAVVSISVEPADTGDGVTVLEDFEGDSPLSKYAGETGGFALDTSAPLEGSVSLESTSTRSAIATDRIATPRGNEYRTRIGTVSGSYQRVLVNVQDPSNPMDDCYALWVGSSWDDIALQERRGGSRTDLVNASHDFSGSERYAVGVSSTDTQVWATLYDTDGNAIVETPKMDSSVHTGGYLGYSSATETGTKWDYTTRSANGIVPTRTLTIESPDGSRVGYEFAVGGDTLEKSDAYDASINPNDAISGSTATGYVSGGRDSYEFSGEVEYVERDGPLELYIDGQQVDPDGFLPRTVTISNRAYDDPAAYELSVTEALGPTDSVNSNDEISGTSADGQVNGGADTYRFAGEIDAFAYDGPVDLYVDGEQVDPDAIGYDRSLSIVGSGPRVGYEFTVGGDLEKSTARNGSINSGDEISGSTATGYVTGGTDSYRFDGEVTDFTVEDSSAVTVYVDGEQVDLGGGNETRILTLESADGSRVEYEFTVGGDTLEKSTAYDASINSEDTISDDGAAGVVYGGRDSYEFSGDVTTLSADGDLLTYLDGQRVTLG
jgi:hypothetical protein